MFLKKKTSLHLQRATNLNLQVLNKANTECVIGGVKISGSEEREKKKKMDDEIELPSL